LALPSHASLGAKKTGHRLLGTDCSGAGGVGRGVRLGGDDRFGGPAVACGSAVNEAIGEDLALATQEGRVPNAKLDARFPSPNERAAACGVTRSQRYFSPPGG
jgi:hypothetical protein